MGHLRVTLSALRDLRPFANKKKCIFGQSKLEYLGHIISTQGVVANPTKFASLVDWPSPRDIKSFKGFWD